MNSVTAYMTTPSEFFKTIENKLIGYDKYLESLKRVLPPEANFNYPPYNLVRVSENKYVLSMAVAGYSIDDISIEKAGNTLKIVGQRPSFLEEQSEDYLHRGIALRNFTREFPLINYMEVTNVYLRNGLLEIEMEYKLPDELAPKQIEIKTKKK